MIEIDIKMLQKLLLDGDHQAVLDLIPEKTNINFGYTCSRVMCLAAAFGDTDLMKILIKNGASPADIQSLHRPLLAAIANGHREASEFLWPFLMAEKDEKIKSVAFLVAVAATHKQDAAGFLKRALDITSPGARFKEMRQASKLTFSFAGAPVIIVSAPDASAFIDAFLSQQDLVDVIAPFPAKRSPPKIM